MHKLLHISQIKRQGAILLFSQKNDNLHTALEFCVSSNGNNDRLSDRKSFSKKKNKKKTANQLIFIQSEKKSTASHLVMQIKECARVTQKQNKRAMTAL